MINLATTISRIAGMTSNDRATAIVQATNATQTDINNPGVGDPLIINDIAAAIRNASSKILDVGQPNQQIDEIYICPSRTDTTRYSRTLVANYTPALGERIALEHQGSRRADASTSGHFSKTIQ